MLRLDSGVSVPDRVVIHSVTVDVSDGTDAGSCALAHVEDDLGSSAPRAQSESALGLRARAGNTLVLRTFLLVRRALGRATAARPPALAMADA